MAPAANELLGVSVATVFPLLKLTVPATGLLLESLSANDTVLGTTACENVAVGATDTGFPVEPAAGVTLVTDGGVLPADCEYTTSTQ